ncbi:hypothetical protein [Novosphingobium lentum]|uniref:hypothetical protein n=1 Tax=Novosphingobium lentum TaxID=145287 RepID=UPI0012ED8B0E|nr:hypothetical protein [Novosphingobium lentum]
MAQKPQQKSSKPPAPKRGRWTADPSRILSVMALSVSVASFAFSQINFNRSERLAIQPSLVFEYEQNYGWKVRNIGAGPALNPLVQLAWDDKQWENPVRIPSIPVNASFSLQWVGSDNVRMLGATYNDNNGRIYSTVTKNDLSSVHTGSTLPMWTESKIRKYWELSKP